MQWKKRQGKAGVKGRKREHHRNERGGRCANLELFMVNIPSFFKLLHHNMRNAAKRFLNWPYCTIFLVVSHWETTQKQRTRPGLSAALHWEKSCWRLERNLTSHAASDAVLSPAVMETREVKMPLQKLQTCLLNAEESEKKTQLHLSFDRKSMHNNQN